MLRVVGAGLCSARSSDETGTSPGTSAYAGAEGGSIYVCEDGAGIGLLVSFALCGWFLRVLVAIILIVLGLLLLK